jgi:dihydropteroate synthase
MGILNVTPDSFSDAGGGFRGGRVDVERVVEAAQRMLDAGASILDVGGESTRPGAKPVAVGEECDRVIPVIERLLQFDTIVSVDTRKQEVARRALGMGCHLVNDVGALRGEGMLEAIAESSAAVCIVHMRGEPGTMQRDPRYADVIGEVHGFLAGRVDACCAAGISRDRLLVDPGVGFGKTLAHNLELLCNLDRLRVDGLPLLVGVSRKSMIGAITGREVADRVIGSAVAAALAVQEGADVVRVHDVAQTADALRIVRAWMATKGVA